MTERCRHGHDPAWLPCHFCHPRECAVLHGAPSTPEELAKVAVQGAAMRKHSYLVESRRSLKLEGETIAGCKVLKKAANATGNTRFHTEMSCGHQMIIDGTLLKQADKQGKILKCKPCQMKAVRAIRSASNKKRAKASKVVT